MLALQGAPGIRMKVPTRHIFVANWRIMMPRRKQGDNAMQTIKVRSRVGPDGRLKLDVPVGVADVDLEVLVVVQPLPKGSSKATAGEPKTPEELGWPPGFFERTAGAIPDFFEFDRYDGLDASRDDDVVLDFDHADDPQQTP